MKIVCLVKFTPDVENFVYDYERNVLVREKTRMVINPDDACALGFALKMKQKSGEVHVEVVTMAPLSVLPYVEDLIRRGVDYVSMISDKRFVGSDTYVTSKIIGRVLKDRDFDCILTGTHAIDGDTSHVPAQIGELLDLPQMSNIISIDEQNISHEYALIEVDGESSTSTYEVELPAILSLSKGSKYKLPYVKYEAVSRDVSAFIEIISNENLKFSDEEVGLVGSKTKVSRTYVKKMTKENRLIVSNDEEGIETVYHFLKQKGFV
jgi:electron transfer flavoprotein beta subunit